MLSSSWQCVVTGLCPVQPSAARQTFSLLSADRLLGRVGLFLTLARQRRRIFMHALAKSALDRKSVV